MKRETNENKRNLAFIRLFRLFAFISSSLFILLTAVSCNSNKNAARPTIVAKPVSTPAPVKRLIKNEGWKVPGIYPGIDIVYYGNGHHLEYDFIVAAGAEPGRIKFSVEGTQMMRLDERGDLMI